MSESDTAAAAINAVRRGKIVIVTDDESRENEGDLVMAADAATEANIAFFLQHTSGLLCIGLDPRRCDRLGLDQMVPDNADPKRTAFTVSVDSKAGVTNGISAGDRAHTLRCLVDPTAEATDFTRPGHIFPLRARQGGVLARPGHTEAAVDLTRLAGRATGGVLCEVVSPDKRTMARRRDLQRLAQEFGLPIVSIAQLIEYRRSAEKHITPTHSALLPTRHGTFECRAWTSQPDGVEHVAMIMGKLDGDEPVLVRLHSECLTGDVMGSQRCDCGQQLDDALAQVAHRKRGVVVYLRGHEGRGIGIGHKLAAYALQDLGRDTVDANIELGLPVDCRDYRVGVDILRELGIRRVQLMTNSPAKCSALAGFGLEITECVPLKPNVTVHNLKYLITKRDRFGHRIDVDLGVASEAPVEDRDARATGPAIC
ncbi:3,4-dihydroxy-2-butanone 4-phosphate synthase [Mycobacterium triplex]|uniref:Riboflavin biosynthesis protein RibBA n=1 Tax=Mycobacterium triplex TaxID=47839 RepID=A0ABX3W926_9MYCO|nr:bifunctional 3,4-dihydroxy-2-butanone-4-phosphate synthase/GTP cyclohydrolase II [Mycobacterium triplex]ORX07099.1 3,4-dihydroxy-2-butanone 4-phosphate synthase [Mycobacterium triplex]